MNLKKCFNKALLTSKMLIEDFTFKCFNRISPSYFTMFRKMGFKETILFMLNMINESVQVELNKFFEGIPNKIVIKSKIDRYITSEVIRLTSFLLKKKKL